MAVRCACPRLFSTAMCGFMFRILICAGFLTSPMVLWLGVLQARTGKDEAPSFPPHPRLATSAAELAKLKQIPGRKDQTVRETQALLNNPVTIPGGWGNWVFYYACPDDARPLDAPSEQEHQCPHCKKVYKDERIVAAYRTLLHDNANAAALQLGWAHALTGDERYAREVRRILLKYADDYASYPARKDRWDRTGFFAQLGGRRYSQSLDEAVGIIKMAKAYDLTRSSPVWTDKERQHVEMDFFRPTADTLLYANQGINNHQTWYNAGLMAIASVLGDKELVSKVLTMRGGFHDQLKRSVGSDGLWYEGTMAYHNYALQAMIEIVDAGRRLGLPLHKEPRFRKMIEVPLQCAYPNGQFPAMNDSDRNFVSSFNDAFLWAWEVYQDPVFAQAYAGGNLKTLKTLLGPNAKVEPFLETRSLNLPDAGLAILRRSSGKEAVCAMIDHGPHGGSHGHYDKLNIVLFANGQEWLLDPGRLTYSHKEYKTWVKHTAAHNTVTLGGASQSATTGKFLWLKVDKDFAACAAETDEAYAGARLRRYLLLTDNVLIDVFDVQAPKETQIDLLSHAISQKVVPHTAEIKLGEGQVIVPGKEDGYQHLTNGLSWTVLKPSQWEFHAGPKKLRLWLDGLAKEEIITCTGIGYTINERVPCLIRRVHGKEARFVTVYDLSGDASFVTGLRRARQGEGEGEGEWILSTRSGERRVAFSKDSLVGITDISHMVGPS